MDGNQPHAFSLWDRVLLLLGLVAILIFIYFSFDGYINSLEFHKNRICFTSDWDAVIYPYGLGRYPYAVWNHTDLNFTNYPEPKASWINTTFELNKTSGYLSFINNSTCLIKESSLTSNFCER